MNKPTDKCIISTSGNEIYCPGCGEKIITVPFKSENDVFDTQTGKKIKYVIRLCPQMYTKMTGNKLKDTNPNE